MSRSLPHALFFPNGSSSLPDMAELRPPPPKPSIPCTSPSSCYTEKNPNTSYLLLLPAAQLLPSRVAQLNFTICRSESSCKPCLQLLSRHRVGGGRDCSPQLWPPTPARNKATPTLFKQWLPMAPGTTFSMGFSWLLLMAPAEARVSCGCWAGG